jgi:hypothetical protein
MELDIAEEKYKEEEKEVKNVKTNEKSVKAHGGDTARLNITMSEFDMKQPSNVLAKVLFEHFCPCSCTSSTAVIVFSSTCLDV